MYVGDVDHETNMMAEGRGSSPYAVKNQLFRVLAISPSSEDNAAADSGSDMTYDFIGSHSSFTEWPLSKVPKRHKVIIKQHPALPQTHPDGSSDSDSDSDSIKSPSISSEDFQHSHGTRTPSPKPLEQEGQVVPAESPCNQKLDLEPVVVKSQDEIFLRQLCYLATDIKQLLIGPAGGTFILGSGDAVLEFPPGAVTKETAIRYAIILNGPFAIADGYKLCSMVVYLNMDGATLVKPVYLVISHWCTREERDDERTLKFIRASHTLKAGQQTYVFEEQEGGDFATHTNRGILIISEPQCLFCVKSKIAKVARYSAITFTRYIQNGLLFRIQIMCDSLEWIERITHALVREGWMKSSDFGTRFQYDAGQHQLTTSLRQRSGPGWEATFEGQSAVSEADFLLPLGKSGYELQAEVNRGHYPPCLICKILYTSPEEKRMMATLMQVHLHGASVPLVFSCIIKEEMPTPPLDAPLATPPPMVPFHDAATSLSPQTTAALHPSDILVALNHELDARWREFGTFLHVDYQIIEAIKTTNGGNVESCMLDLLGKWTSNQAGTGTLPRTWQTVVDAVKKTGFVQLAEDLACKHGVNLSH